MDNWIILYLIFNVVNWYRFFKVFIIILKVNKIRFLSIIFCFFNIYI